MASKRRLKKEVIFATTALFDEALLLRAFADKEEAAKIEELMDDLIVFTDDTLRRVQHTDGADNPKLVRAYYRKLRSDLANKVEAFNDRLTKHLESL